MQRNAYVGEKIEDMYEKEYFNQQNKRAVSLSFIAAALI